MLCVLSFSSGLLQSPGRLAVRQMGITMMAEPAAVASWYDAGMRLTPEAVPEPTWPPEEAWPLESKEHYYARMGVEPPSEAEQVVEPAAEEAAEEVGKVVPLVGKLKKASIKRAQNIDLNEQQQAFEARMRAKQTAKK